MQGNKKRARVQVVVQGQGGRIIKNENWLLGLGPGERLSYSVSVIQDDEDDEDQERDPTAASSTNVEKPEASGEAEDTKEGPEEKEVADTLPVTGECPAEMWDEVDTSVAKDMDVDDFMQTELATKFYNYWKSGTVTDRLIGQRFGYGVLRPLLQQSAMGPRLFRRCGRRGRRWRDQQCWGQVSGGG